MIFCAKNEDGIPTWKLVLEGKKTVTRRLKPMPVGKVFAVQPGRGQKAVCYAKVKSCIETLQHAIDNAVGYYDYDKIEEYEQTEARLEGFKTWNGLMQWFNEHNINFMDTYRIEFEVVSKRSIENHDK